MKLWKDVCCWTLLGYTEVSCQDLNMWYIKKLVNFELWVSVAECCLCEMVGARYSLWFLVSYPGSWWVGKERSWYPLFAHMLNFPEILENWQLSVQLWHHSVYLPLHCLHVFWPTVLSILWSPAPSSALWLSIADWVSVVNIYWGNVCFDEREKCLCMVLNFPQILGIGNYCVIPIQLWHHNVHLALQCLHIFWPTIKFFFILCSPSPSSALQRPPVPSNDYILLIESQLWTFAEEMCMATALPGLCDTKYHWLS